MPVYYKGTVFSKARLMELTQEDLKRTVAGLVLKLIKEPEDYVTRCILADALSDLTGDITKTEPLRQEEGYWSALRIHQVYASVMESEWRIYWNNSKDRFPLAPDRRPGTDQCNLPVGVAVFHNSPRLIECSHDPCHNRFEVVRGEIRLYCSKSTGWKWLCSRCLSSRRSNVTLSIGD